MDDKKLRVNSKFLSLLLRHKPELIGLRLDKNGWADVNELLEKVRAHGKDLDVQILEEIVATNDKKRFSFNADKTRIRANQGHSVNIELGLEPQIPPEILFHGTGEKSVQSILNSGLHKRNRHHVHLSPDIATALAVGKRHGKPVVFEILAGEMSKEGIQFFISENGVWLTEEVPVKFLRLKD